jgi:hypothetical protein
MIENRKESLMAYLAGYTEARLHEIEELLSRNDPNKALTKAHEAIAKCKVVTNSIIHSEDAQEKILREELLNG